MEVPIQGLLIAGAVIAAVVAAVESGRRRAKRLVQRHKEMLGPDLYERVRSTAEAHPQGSAAAAIQDLLHQRDSARDELAQLSRARDEVLQDAAVAREELARVRDAVSKSEHALAALENAILHCEERLASPSASRLAVDHAADDPRPPELEDKEFGQRLKPRARGGRT